MALTTKECEDYFGEATQGSVGYPDETFITSIISFRTQSYKTYVTYLCNFTMKVGACLTRTSITKQSCLV